MSAALRRGACPALSAPMPTGDGLLVRLSPVSGGLSPKSLTGLCESAARHGNGVVEVTSRGSLQFRGFSALSAERFVEDVDSLRMAVRTGVPVEVSPLAGMDPAEIADAAVAERIREGIDAAGLTSKLGPKVSVVVDGGGSVSLDSIAADVRLTAEVRDGGVVWQVAIAGNAETAIPAGFFDEDAAVGYALQVLQSIAALGRGGRARDLPVGGRLDRWRPTLPPSVLPDISPTRGEIGRIDLAATPATSTIGETQAAGLVSPLVGEMSGRTEGGAKERDLMEASSPPPSPPKRTVPLTVRLKNDRHALLIALPFGHVDAARLIELARQAETLGVADIRPAPARTLLPICPSFDAADALRVEATRLGFVTDPADPRASIAACPGAPACASGKIAAREIAEQTARGLAGVGNTDFSIHISGCEKGCARQATADIAIVGGENGAGLVVQGTPKAMPLAYRSENGLPQAIAAVARVLNGLRAARTGGARVEADAIGSRRAPRDSVVALTGEDKARLAAAFEREGP